MNISTCCLFITLLLFFSLIKVNAVTLENNPELLYRYNMAANTSNLLNIREKFGKILQSGDVLFSFNASKDVVEMLDKIGNDLDTIEVPENMQKPYNVFIDSVKNYRKSATCVRNATEILLGYFDGTESEVEELMKQGGNYVEIANKYFDLSINLHSEAFDKNKSNIDDLFNTSDDKEKDKIDEMINNDSFKIAI